MTLACGSILAVVTSRSTARPSPHPLRGCWLKLKRAEEHRKSLADRVDDFFRQEPERVVASAPKDGQVRATLRGLDELPADWSAIAGDCLQCLRSSLEHIAYACARRRMVRPPRAVEFPIRKDLESWNAYTAGKTARDNRKAVGDDAWALFEQVQPHVRSRRHSPETKPESDPLWVLHELAKIDRHRTLHLAVVETEGSASFFGPLPQEGNIVTWLDGTKRLATPPTTPEPESSPWSFTGDVEFVGHDGAKGEMRSFNHLPFAVAFDPDGDVAQGFSLLETMERIEVDIRQGILPPFQSLLRARS